MSKLTKKTFVEELKKMSVKEVMELVDALKEEFGIDPQAVAAAPQAQGEAEQKSEVTVTLVNVGPNKVPVIKAVREITGLGLMEAKKLTDTVPGVVKANIKPDEAEKIKKTLTDAGAEVKVE